MADIKPGTLGARNHQLKLVAKQQLFDHFQLHLTWIDRSTRSAARTLAKVFCARVEWGARGACHEIQQYSHCCCDRNLRAAGYPLSRWRDSCLRIYHVGDDELATVHASESALAAAQQGAFIRAFARLPGEGHFAGPPRLRFGLPFRCFATNSMPTRTVTEI